MFSKSPPPEDKRFYISNWPTMSPWLSVPRIVSHFSGRSRAHR